jgi:protein SCO1/2
MRPRARGRAPGSGVTCAMLLLLAVLVPAAAGAQDFAGGTPPELEGIDLVDHAGTALPRDLVLRDEAGQPVRLGDFFDHGRPLVMQLVYYDCPMLCTLVLNGYVEAAKELDWVPGRDYDVVTVSFDPRDTPEVATAKKKSYVASLEKPGAAAGWHFLTGDSAVVRVLADSLGFAYRWLPQKQQFAHAAGMFVLTPDGTVSRTLYGITFPGKDLRLSLVEAGKGKLGSPVDKLLLYCFQYDPATHKYAMVAVNVMKLGGFVTVLILGGFLALQWVRSRRKARTAGEPAAARRARPPMTKMHTGSHR